MKKWQFWLLTVFVWVTEVVLVEAASDPPSSFTCSSDSVGSVTCVVPGMSKPVSIIGNMGMIGNKSLKFNFVSGPSKPNRSFTCTWNQETKRYDCTDQGLVPPLGEVTAADCNNSVCVPQFVRALRLTPCANCTHFYLVASKKDESASLVLSKKFSYRPSDDGLIVANGVILYPPGIVKPDELVGATWLMRSDLKHPKTFNLSLYGSGLPQR